MKRIVVRSLVIIAIVITPGLGASGEELSTRVFPSEDEIRRAFELEIFSYEQYERLLEISQRGVTTNDWYLFNEIPNLLVVDSIPGNLDTDLSREQRKSFQASRPALRGELSVRSAHEMDEDPRSRYRTRLTLQLGENWFGTMRLNREFTGRERFVERTIEYRSKVGMIRHVTAGSFSRRFGLGTVIGHPGKRLSHSRKPDVESFLYPDYGGFNGLAFELQQKMWTVEGLGSVTRDDNHRIETLGLLVSRRTGPLQSSIITALTNLTNRLRRMTSHDIKSAINLSYQYERGKVTAELGSQFKRSTAIALVLEGRHRFSRTELAFAGWTYGKEYCAITSGSRSAGISRQFTMEDVDYCFSDRRAGQRGAILRTVVQFGSAWQLVSALEQAGVSVDTSLTEFLGGLRYQLYPRASIRGDYQYKNRRRSGGSSGSNYFEHRFRLESRFETGGLDGRTYIARSRGDRHGNYWSFFCRLTVQMADGAIIRVWSDMARIKDSQIDYWYGFVQYGQRLFENVSIGAKFMHRYNRHASRKHETDIGLELTAAL